ncbi:hypothetical protein [Serratia proteamaculans]|uniref:Uncharacterized protein n=1 Tax=Serratia proteamaculans TaxID=28151 RepID=A0A5Q2VCI5_SERPR|nr:hypothetical protein [Serratia proteamaculans]QGH61291.1 hypothetical protein GHV41_10750 [Serratia proteamaculans]
MRQKSVYETRVYSDIIGHIHISEPNLIPLGRSATNHVGIASALNDALPHHTITIEMVETQNEAPLIAIGEALDFVTRHYRHSAEAAV